MLRYPKWKRRTFLFAVIIVRFSRFFTRSTSLHLGGVFWEVFSLFYFVNKKWGREVLQFYVVRMSSFTQRILVNTHQHNLTGWGSFRSPTSGHNEATSSLKGVRIESVSISGNFCWEDWKEIYWMSQPSSCVFCLQKATSVHLFCNLHLWAWLFIYIVRVKIVSLEKQYRYYYFLYTMLLLLSVNLYIFFF